jgi:UDP-glucose 4-epimerase
MRDHIHVDDVVRITHMCLEQQSTGVLNLATGRSISFRKVAELVALHFGERAEIVSRPRANAITHRHYDVTSLIKAFPGYRPIPIEEGIARCHREMVQAA